MYLKSLHAHSSLPTNVLQHLLKNPDIKSLPMMINDYGLITVELTKPRCPRGVLLFKRHRCKPKKLSNINVTAFSRGRKPSEWPRDGGLQAHPRVSPKPNLWGLNLNFNRQSFRAGAVAVCLRWVGQV